MDVLWFVFIAGSLAAAAALATRSLFGRDPVPTQLVAAGTLAWFWATLGMQLLGTLGQISRPALLAWNGVGLLVAALLQLAPWNARPVPDLAADPGTSRPNESPIELLTTVALVLWVVLILWARAIVSPVKVVSDGPIYHLHFAIRWWHSGAITRIASPFGESAATYFPANGELWFAWLITAWNGDRLARAGQAPFLLLAGLALLAILRGLGRSWTSSAIAVSLVLTLLPWLLFTFEPNVDSIFVAGYVVATFFLFAYVHQHRGLPSIVLAGLAAGLALGTKPTALLFIPVWMLFAAVVLGLRPADSSGASRARAIGTLALSSLVPSASWMASNAIETGNPWYPLHLEVLGHVVLQGWYERSAMQLSPFYIALGDWRACVDILVVVLDPRLLPLWIGAVVGVWIPQRAEKPRVAARWTIGLTLLGLANVALYWLVIPYRTQQRFMLQGLALFAAPLALLFDRSRTVRGLALGLLAIHLLTPFNWPFVPADQQPPWSLRKIIPAIPEAMIGVPLSLDAWRDLFAPRTDRFEQLVQLSARTRLCLGIVSFALAGLWVLIWRRSGPRGRALWIGAGAFFSLLGASLWYGYGTGALKVMYPPFEYYQAWTFFEGACPPRGARVAYAGTNLPYYLAGKDLRNRVTYVNVSGQAADQMADFHRRAIASGKPGLWPTPRPGWDRIEPDYSEWLRNLDAADIDFLFVARSNPADGLFNCADRENFPIERVWADAHPEKFHLIYGGNVIDPRLGSQPDRLVRIYRVTR